MNINQPTMTSKLLKVTLDTNLLIDLEDEREDADCVRQIIEWHNRKQLIAAVPAVIASEKLIDGKAIDNFKDFEVFLRDCGLVEPVTSSTMTRLGMAFFDSGFMLAGENMKVA